LERTNQHESNIRLCICTDLWLGLQSGAIERILKFAENVSKQDVKVYLIDRSIKKSFSGIFSDDDKYYTLENGQITEHRFPFYVRFILPGVVKFLQGSLDHWISRLTRTSLNEPGYSLFVDPYLLVKLFYICKTERINLIQCEFPCTTFSSWIIKKMSGIPLIYDAHNIESERIRTMKNVNKIHVSIVRKLEIKSCKICDSIFVVSKRDRKHLISWGIPEKKVTVIPNSVEISKFYPELDDQRIRKQYKLENAFLIIFHGSLNYLPNMEAVEILIKILPQILEKYPGVYLLIVGKNPPKISNPHIITTGFVQNPIEYIAAADLAVVPLVSGGGTKLKMLDYMACGKAIVSTEEGAKGLDLANKKDILTTPYPDSKFIDLVMQAIEDADLRQKLGENARKKVKQLYDWETNAAKAISIYRELIQDHSTLV
jgi:polysaccharide biosynthesis protein PslH